LYISQQENVINVEVRQDHYDKYLNQV
jgi:hypothetical protein